MAINALDETVSALKKKAGGELHSIEQESRRLISLAITYHASDIHIRPGPQQAQVFFRQGAELIRHSSMNKRKAERLISHFKFRAGMDIGEQRRPQHGALMDHNFHVPLSLRFSTLPTPFKESLVVRLLPQNESLPLQELSLFPKQVSLFYELLKERQGMFVITGPTGTGKTTTLYTLLHSLQAQEPLNIISIEDPIEKRSEQFIQVQINEKAGLTYQEILKSALRHDPDILMIGEIRDEETAKLAVRAALTGHLVLTTLHSRDAYGAITRLLDLHVSRYDLNDTLLAVVSQRLVLRYCPFCKHHCTPYCPRYHHANRTAIYDIIYGDSLKKALQRSSLMYETPNGLQAQYKKGLALGYLAFSDSNGGIIR